MDLKGEVEASFDPVYPEDHEVEMFEVYECRECGSLTRAKWTHWLWHDRLNDRFREVRDAAE